jgi:uncharacterized protein YciI
MKKISNWMFGLLLGMSVLIACQQKNTEQVVVAKDTLSTVQKAEMELKTYYFVLLVKGANRTQDSATAAKIQEGHLQNIDRLAKEGKINIAGPFAQKGDWRGIFIFNSSDSLEVKTLLETDPAIQSGRLSYIMMPWMSAKGVCLQ